MRLEDLFLTLTERHLPRAHGFRRHARSAWNFKQPDWAYQHNHLTWHEGWLQPLRDRCAFTNTLTQGRQLQRSEIGHRECSERQVAEGLHWTTWIRSASCCEQGLSKSWALRSVVGLGGHLHAAQHLLAVSGPGMPVLTCAAFALAPGPGYREHKLVSITSVYPPRKSCIIPTCLQSKK